MQKAQDTNSDHRLTEDRYRALWNWDAWKWSSHCGNCIANCSYRIYIRDGEPLWEEVSGTAPGNAGVPDMNPLGCQKGVAWLSMRSGGERLLFPMRRVGERGSGRWERISWDEALQRIADAVIDAVEEQGTHSIIFDCNTESGVTGPAARVRLISALDGIALDGNATVSDVHQGHWLTFGNLLAGSTADDVFNAELVVIWQGNPAYTRIPYYHFIPEARYRGARVVTISPDFSPSAVHADIHIPIEPGTDAAFALAACKVVIDENLYDREFVASQTDLPLLVKLSDRRFLTLRDLDKAAPANRFVVWKDGPRAANPKILGDPADPALEGVFELELANGSKERVAPVFELLKQRLEDYSPEAASQICKVHPDTIADFARLVARSKTKLCNGLGSCKHYHGDLMERSMDLLLALTGNWGKRGTGFWTYIIALLEGEVLGLLKQGRGALASEKALAALDAILAQLRQTDESITEGKAFLQMMRMVAPRANVAPPAFFLYHHGGFAEIWDRQGWSDSPRPIGAYVEEATSKGWWGGLVKPARDVEPRVLFQTGTNILRRTRGGQRQLLQHLWPKLSLIVAIDWKVPTAGLFADIVLPAAHEAEKLDLHAANSHSWERMLSEQACEPLGEAWSDCRIFVEIGRAIARRAKERGKSEFVDSTGVRRSWAQLEQIFPPYRPRATEEEIVDEVLRDSALSGNLPEHASLGTLRETGMVAPVALPRALRAVTGGELTPGEVFVAYEDHVRRGIPYPTHTGRAQFYIDHPWFIEADEALPRHKNPPPAGGNYPLAVTGGHPRWSIHATNTTTRLMLETTRGRPCVHLNTADAEARRISDGDLVRVYNDCGEYVAMAKVSPAVRPGQLILYASWEPYLFPEWKDGTWVEPGLVKWLHFAGGYGHLGYTELQWQPTQYDRVFRVEVEPLRAP
jgi:DMSO reductase family type II enzyme molybdopterin subunit